MIQPKNTSKLRTWDDAAFFRKGTVTKTNKKNPYQKNTLEFVLVDYIISLSGKILNNKNSTELLKILKKKKFFLSLDPWSLSHLGDKAVWLALNSGCIKFKYTIHSTDKNFAVHMQSGLLDLFHEPAYLNKLIIEAPNDEKLNHLKKVALLSSDLKKIFGLPIMKENLGTIEISNYKSWVMERSEAIPLIKPTLPIQTWAKSNPAYVKAQTRGIFHHLGDEMAFICAAIQYGNCYVVGNDEFGDLVVLATIIGKDSQGLDFNLGQICDPMDFDYVYSVPVTNAMYPSERNQCFNYSSENHEQCKVNNLENSEFSNKYWKNDYFKQQSQREMNDLSVNQLVEKLIKSIKSVMSEEDHLKYQKVFSVDFIRNINLLHLFRIIKIKEFKQQLSNETSFDDFSHNFNLIRHKAFSLLELDYNHFYLNALDYKGGAKRARNFLSIIFSEITPSILEMKKLILKYEVLIQDDFSFFYKTVSHKAHCDIMNPKKIDSSGFFMKDGNSTKPQHLSLSHIFSEIIQGINSENLGISLVTKTLKENSKIIEKSLNNNLMFNTHKSILKNNIASRLPKSENLYDLIDFWDELDVPAFVVSNIVDMQNEYRIFIINNRPAAASPCFRNTTPFNAWDKGRFDPRLCNGHSANDYFLTPESRCRVAMYAKYAKEFARELKQLYPNFNNFVLDVAYSQDANNGKGGVIPIEINSITWSGAYQIDFRRVCAAIAKVPYRLSDMDELGDFRRLLNQSQDKLTEIYNNQDDYEKIVDKITIGTGIFEQSIDENLDEDLEEELNSELNKEFKLFFDNGSLDDENIDCEHEKNKIL